MSTEINSNDRIHVIYLSREASYQNIESNPSSNDTLVMGFYDNFTELFQSNGKGGNDIDYLSAFGIHTPSFLYEKHLTAKQLFTLEEFEKPLNCHYQTKCTDENSKVSEWVFGEDSATPNQPAPHHGQTIIPQGENPALSAKEEIKGAMYPTFVGVILVSLNYFHRDEAKAKAENADYLEKIRKHLETFICKSRSEKNVPDAAGEISRYAEVRLFKCTNCSDLCVTVSTIRLLDILLISKAVQICVREKARAQFSPVWSFVTLPTRALVEPNDANSERSAFDHYIKTVVAANSFRHNRDNFVPDQVHNQESITVDFRVSFHDFTKERDFLKILKSADEFEKEAHEIDDMHRVAGVLGNGTYSIHLPFHEYLELFRFKYLNKQTLLGKIKELPENQKLLEFLIHEITGRKDLNSNSEVPGSCTVDISYQRIRFCYLGHLYDELYRIGNEDKPAESRFLKAEHEIETKGALYNAQVQGDKIAKLIHHLLDELSVYRNRIHSNEYRFREAVYLAKDLVYTYDDLFARGNLHTVIFATQLMAMLRDTSIYCDLFTKENRGKTKARALVNEAIENLRLACLALNRYNHEVVMNAGNNFNAQNYEIQSKVNIEKYIVAYSQFLLSIYMDYRKQYRGLVPCNLLPFVYLDIEETKIQIYTLFRKLKYLEERPASPVILAVAVPNYRRFANIYRVLPQLVHEISHQFVYYGDRTEENNFVLDRAAEYLAEMFAKEFCGISEWEEADALKKLRKRITEQFEQGLRNHMDRFISKSSLQTEPEELIKDRILLPYAKKHMIIVSSYANKMTSFFGYKKLEQLQWSQIACALEKLAVLTGVSFRMSTDELTEWMSNPNADYSTDIMLSAFFEMMNSVIKNDFDQAQQLLKILCRVIALKAVLDQKLEKGSASADQIIEQVMKESDEIIRFQIREETNGENKIIGINIHHQLFEPNHAYCVIALSKF